MVGARLMGAEGGGTVRFRFERHEPDGGLARFKRDLPDEEAALEWMGNESLQPGDVLKAFRGGESEPFARRASGETVEVWHPRCPRAAVLPDTRPGPCHLPGVRRSRAGPELTGWSVNSPANSTT